MIEQLQPHGFLQDLALVLIVAAATTVVFQKLKQPAVLGYLLAGLIVGPYVPIPLVADLDRIHTLSELGIILVMFAIGLEFSFRKLARLATTAGVIGVLQICIMVWLGYTVGMLLGWSRVESLYMGAMISVSSTMIIAKAFEDQSLKERFTELVIGVLIVEDVAAILMIAILSAFSPGKEAPAAVLLTTGLQLSAFLIVGLVAGILIVPRVIRAAVKLNSDETLLIVSVGFCFAYAYLAQKSGYSVALGAFIAGSIVAESGHTHQIERLVRPLRDVFAAVFFISVGMLMDPRILFNYWQAIAAITVIVIIGKIASVSLGAFLMGSDPRTSVRAGMSMAQIGEFSFIIAAAGVASGVIGEFLYPIGIAVCVITTFTTPGFIRISSRLATSLDRILPDKLKTLTTLYSSWVARTRAVRTVAAPRTSRIVKILILDMVLLAALTAAQSIYRIPLREMVRRILPVSASTAELIVVAVSILLAVPFFISIVRASRTLGTILATEVLPVSSKLDLADAPRSAMTLVIEFIAVLLVGVILTAVTLPFVSVLYGVVILGIIVAVFGVVVWRGATDLEAHVRAGAQVIIEALSTATAPHQEVADNIEQLLPGLGEIFPVKLTDQNPAVGKTLATLDVHGLTGALVVAIVRNSNHVVVPGGNEVLQSGDILALLGSEEAVESARKLLSDGTQS